MINAYEYAKEKNLPTSFKKNESSGEFLHGYSFAEEVRFKKSTKEDEIIVGNVIRETRCYAFVLCPGNELKKKKKTSFIPMPVISTSPHSPTCNSNSSPPPRSVDEKSSMKKRRNFIHEGGSFMKKRRKLIHEGTHIQASMATKNIATASIRAPPGFEGVIPSPVMLGPTRPPRSAKEKKSMNARSIIARKSFGSIFLYLGCAPK